MSSIKILAINPGNTSTKIGSFIQESMSWIETIKHKDEELLPFPSINAQKDFRTNKILEFLTRKGENIEDFKAIACRGGLLKPLKSGTYRVNEKMISDLIKAEIGEHASNLAAQIGYELEMKYKIPAYIVDPVSVDELSPLARYTGHPLFHRRSLSHALNMKAVAKRFCKENGLEYLLQNLLVIHLGTGVSLSIHSRGEMIDIVNPSEEGAFSVDRSGGLPILQVVKYVLENRLTYKEFEKMVFGQGGIFAYLQTKDFSEVSKKYLAGSTREREIVLAMAYQIAKEAGALATVVAGKVDAILITGGIAYNQYFVDLLKEKLKFIAPIFVYPGEEELQALSEGVLRVLKGEEQELIYE